MMTDEKEGDCGKEEFWNRGRKSSSMYLSPDRILPMGIRLHQCKTGRTGESSENAFAFILYPLFPHSLRFVKSFQTTPVSSGLQR
jgi:hypothetical protein